MPLARTGRVIQYSTLGFGYALIMGLLAFLMSGAGHGWTSAIKCWPGLVVLPMIGVALALDRKSTRQIILWFVVVVMFYVDWTIVDATYNEGWSYVERVRRSIPGIFLTWLMGWIGWQLFVIVVLIRTYVRSLPNQEREH